MIGMGESKKQVGVLGLGRMGAALASADVVLSCLSTYDSQRPVLEAASSKVLVNLTPGTPAEARDLAAWASSTGIASVIEEIR
jgi:3-hydroxyisobutyrate dehydrogenase-like beta-hydroxyacid dehydrogenase